MKKKQTIPLFFIISLILISTVIALEVFKPEPEEKHYKVKKLKVFVQSTQHEKTQLFAYSQGEVRPKQQVVIKSQAEGKVVYISPNLIDGGRVSEGELLLSLEDQDYRLAVIEKEAVVAKSNQQLIKVKAQAHVARKELQALGRKKPDELALWLPQLAQAEAELKAAKAALDKAILALSRTKIYSPYTGIVRNENVSLSQLVGKNNSLATIYATEVMEVKLALNGEQLDLINLPIDFYAGNASAKIALDLSAKIGSKTLTWKGVIKRTAGEFDTRTRSINVIAEVNQIENQPLLLPGLFVNAKIHGQYVEHATTLNRTALRPNNRVWIVDNENLLQYQSVTPVYRNQEYVVVTGLSNNSKVVTSALVSPTPGLAVKALNQKVEQTPKKEQLTPAAIKKVIINNNISNPKEPI